MISRSDIVGRVERLWPPGGHMHDESALDAHYRQPTRPLGVLMLDTRFPRLLGDVGNALTWPFPVLYRVVRGAHPERMAQATPDPDILTPFIDAAQGLE